MHRSASNIVTSEAQQSLTKGAYLPQQVRISAGVSCCSSIRMLPIYTSCFNSRSAALTARIHIYFSRNNFPLNSFGWFLGGKQKPRYFVPISNCHLEPVATTRECWTVMLRRMPLLVFESLLMLYFKEFSGLFHSCFCLITFFAATVHSL